MTKKKRKKTQVTKVRTYITTDFTEVKYVRREYCEQLYANELENLDEMDKFLEAHNIPKGSQKTYKVSIGP